jgi:hypothetical protein
MITGLAIVILIVVIAHFFRQKKWWLKAHRLGGSLASLVLLSGLSVAIYMVATTTGAHFAHLHTWLGLVTVVLAFTTTTLGYGKQRGSIKMERTTYRRIHISMAALLVVTMCITIYLGFALVL